MVRSESEYRCWCDLGHVDMSFTGEHEDKSESLPRRFVAKTGQEHMGKVPGTKRVLSKWQW